MKCPKCDLPLSGNAKYCNHCGVEITGKFCPNPECGRAGLPLEANFCPDCRTPLEKVVEEENSFFIVGADNNKGFTSHWSYLGNSSGNTGLVGEHLLVAKPEPQKKSPEKRSKGNPRKNLKEIEEQQIQVNKATENYNNWRALSDRNKTKYAWNEYNWGVYWYHKINDLVVDKLSSSSSIIGWFINLLLMILFVSTIGAMIILPLILIGILTSPLNFLLFKNNIIDEHTESLREWVKYNREKLAELRKEN